MINFLMEMSCRMDRVVSGLARDALDASRRMSDSGMGERGEGGLEK